jgi:hypothetical protein
MEMLRLIGIDSEVQHVSDAEGDRPDEQRDHHRGLHRTDRLRGVSPHAPRTMVGVFAISHAQQIPNRGIAIAVPPCVHSGPESGFRPAIIVAAYDCEATIAEVVTRTRALALPLLVVDDGSADRTAAIARAAGAEVVSHPMNRGKGAALLSGMQVLARRGYSHAVTMDGDGQHLASEIPRLLERAIAFPTAIVIGVRQIGEQPVAGIKLFGNRCANLAVSTAAGVPVPDSQSGFRSYPLASVLPLPIQGRRFEYESTVIIVAARAGIPICSVPVGVYYPPVNERRSHYRTVGDTVRIIRAVLPLWLRAHGFPPQRHRRRVQRASTASGAPLQMIR